MHANPKNKKQKYKVVCPFHPFSISIWIFLNNILSLHNNNNNNNKGFILSDGTYAQISGTQVKIHW